MGLHSNTHRHLRSVLGPDAAADISDALTSKTLALGDVTLTYDPANPQVDLGDPIILDPDHPTLTTIGLHATLPSDDPGYEGVVNGAVRLKLQTDYQGGELTAFAGAFAVQDIGAPAPGVLGDPPVTLVIASPLTMQLEAIFQPGTSPEWDVTSVGPDFKLSFEGTPLPTVFSHGAPAADLQAELVAQVGDGWTVTGGPGTYRVVGPLGGPDGALDVVGTDDVFHSGTGGAIQQVFGAPAPPAQVTLNDVVVFCE